MISFWLVLNCKKYNRKPKCTGHSSVLTTFCHSFKEVCTGSNVKQLLADSVYPSVWQNILRVTFIYKCRNSRIMGCLRTRVRWISCRMKEIGLLKRSNTLAAQQSQYVGLLRLSVTNRKHAINVINHHTEMLRSGLDVFFNLLKPGPQKCRANWVAGFSKPVFGTRNTFGQHWRLQKGKEPCPAMTHDSS